MVVEEEEEGGGKGEAEDAEGQWMAQKTGQEGREFSSGVWLGFS